MARLSLAFVLVLALLAGPPRALAQCDPVPPDDLDCDPAEQIPPFGVGRTSYVEDIPSLGFTGNCVQDYRLFLPPGTKPTNGWPVLIHLDLSGFSATVDFPCLNPEAGPTMTMPPKNATAYNQRRLAKIRESGIAVVTARATLSQPPGAPGWTNACPSGLGCPTLTLPGGGLFHPPGAMSLVNGVPTETYGQLEYATPEKDAVMVIQHVRYWAQQQDILMPDPNDVRQALTNLDPANIVVDGGSAGAIALMWAALGPDRGLQSPFFGHGGQYDVSGKPKAAILKHGLIWPPLMSECLSGHHFGCDGSGVCCGVQSPVCNEPCTGFGSSATTAALSLIYADARELVESGAFWYSQGIPPIEIYMRYDQDFVCTDYSDNGPRSAPTCGSPSCTYQYPSSFTQQGLETQVHPTWSGYAWEALHPTTTRLVVSGCAAYEKKNAPQDVPVDLSGMIGIIPQTPQETTTTEEDEFTTDEIVWLRRIFGMDAHPDPWVTLEWASVQGNCVKASVAGTNGTPILTGTGTLVAGTNLTLTLTNAIPSTAGGLLFVGAGQLFARFKGGAMIPTTDTSIAIMTDASGTWSFTAPWPSGLTGVSTYYQAWMPDMVAPQGASGSNGLMSIGQ